MKTLLRIQKMFYVAALYAGSVVGGLADKPDAAQQLRSMGIEPSGSGIGEALGHDNPLVKTLAIQTIAERQESVYDSQIRQLLHDNSPFVRLESSKYLARKGEVEAKQVLITLLEMDFKTRTEQNVKIEAAATLAELGDSRGYTLVQEAFLNEKYQGARLTAARALPKFIRFRAEGIDVVSVLVEGLEKTRDRIEEKLRAGTKEYYDGNNLLFLWITTALEQTGDERALKALDASSASEDPFVKSASERARLKIQEQMNERR